MDLTFNNSIIKAYFDGDDSYVPSSELIWLHTHPLVTPNFLTQLEELILEAGRIIIAKNMNGYPIAKLEELAIKIGTELPDITLETAPKILDAMRELYKLCNVITGKPA